MIPLLLQVEDYGMLQPVIDAINGLGEAGRDTVISLASVVVVFLMCRIALGSFRTLTGIGRPKDPHDDGYF